MGKSIVYLFTIICVVAVFAVGAHYYQLPFTETFKTPFKISPKYLASQISNFLNQTDGLPHAIMVPVYENDETLQVARLRTTIREDYSRILKKYLERYKPDYGAIAVMNPDTGALLALESYSRNADENLGHLSLNASFPAASIFKIVTAAAAIDQGKAYAETIISFNGRNHTLYKKHVQDQSITPWTNHVTLREAFGKSINTVFGKLGLYHVGLKDLKKYAQAFYFNRNIPSDIHIEPSQFVIDSTDPWQLVESSAGFTRRTTLSPIHGAMIASAILNDGRLQAPYVVDSMVNENGEAIYNHESKPLENIMQGYSAQQMQLLMEETITNGTSRKPFRGLAYTDSEVQIGGKTGSLTGETIQGKTDWFVGYATHNNQKLAIGVVTVHKKYWTVKSSMLARLFFEEVFDAAESASRKISSQQKISLKK